MSDKRDVQNLKETWKFYLIFFLGLAFLWLSRKTEPPLSTVFATLGGLGFFVGAVLLMLWDRRKKKEEKRRQEQNKL